MSIEQYRESIRGKKKSKPPKKFHEDALHVACMDWIRTQQMSHPILYWLHHSPNGGARSLKEGIRFKRMGVKRGFPDFLIPFKSGQWLGLAIELKSDHGVVSAFQKEWMTAFDSYGYCCGVCRDLDGFIKVVNQFLKGDVNANINA